MSEFALGARFRTGKESSVGLWLPKPDLPTIYIQYLVIGGAGGGGCAVSSSPSSGSGGAGGYRNSAQVTSETSGGVSGSRWPDQPLALPKGDYVITVGGGGSGASVTFNPIVITDSTSGSFSSITGQGLYIISEGGGKGGSSRGSDSVAAGVVDGYSGGSGGSGAYSQYGSGSSGSGTSNQGNNAGSWGDLRPGGSGGAGTAGGNGSGTTIGSAGAGLSSSITGSAVTRAAGATGRTTSGTAASGAANTGNGGQGAYSTPGGAGGSGVVIIRYVTAEKTAKGLTITGGTTSTSGIYSIHTFNSSGNFTISY